MRMLNKIHAIICQSYKIMMKNHVRNADIIHSFIPPARTLKLSQWSGLTLKL